MLRVLMYLFENYSEHHANVISDQEVLSSTLERAGFNRYEIHDALNWLQGFRDFQDTEDTLAAMQNYSQRFYDMEEKEKIDEEARYLLAFLEQSGILAPALRELVIDRAMAMDDITDLSQMKWIVLITLYHHPSSDREALHWMQDFVMYGDTKH